MSKKIDKIKPAVDKSALIFLSFFVWVVVGRVLLLFAYSWLKASQVNSSFLFVGMGVGAAYECSQSKNLKFCGDCDEFPCDNLHPYADKANTLPHNIKVFNLCLINRMGLEKWAEFKASEVRKVYFTKPWTLT